MAHPSLLFSPQIYLGVSDSLIWNVCDSVRLSALWDCEFSPSFNEDSSLLRPYALSAIASEDSFFTCLFVSVRSSVKNLVSCVVSGFRRDVNEISALLGFVRSVYWFLSNWRFGTTYRSHLQGPNAPRRNYSLIAWPLKMGPIGCPETSVT